MWKTFFLANCLQVILLFRRFATWNPVEDRELRESEPQNIEGKTK